MIEICVKSSVESSVDLRESQKWRWLKFGESKLFFCEDGPACKMYFRSTLIRASYTIFRCIFRFTYTIVLCMCVCTCVCTYGMECNVM